MKSDPAAQKFFQQVKQGHLLKGLQSIPAEKENLILPLLLTVREDESLHDSNLWRPNLGPPHNSITCYDLALRDGVSWGDSTGTPYKKLSDFLTRGVFVYVCHLPSLRALPLFKAKRLRVVYGLYDRSANKPVPRVLKSKDYAEIARLLQVDMLEEFLLTPNYDHDPDDVLSIESFAEAIAEQRALKKFSIPRYIGIKNLEYLLIQGVAPNRSLQSLYFGQIYGDYPVALMGQMLANNSSLLFLEMRCEMLRDLECLNVFGKHLEKNTTLQNLKIQINPLAGPKEKKVPYYKPLPGRLHKQPVENLLPFKKALGLFQGTLELINSNGRKEFDVLFEEIEQERIHCILSSKTLLDTVNIPGVGSINLKNTKEVSFHSKMMGAAEIKRLSQGNLHCIEKLDLSFNHIHDEGLRFLSHSNFESLTHLYLVNNKITSAGLTYLSDSFLKSLTHLKLNGNQIDHEGAKIISQGGFKSLKMLDLSGNRIGDGGFIALFHGELPILEALILSSNAITDAGIEKSINHSLKSLNHLNLYGNSINKWERVGPTENCLSRLPQ